MEHGCVQHMTPICPNQKILQCIFFISATYILGKYFLILRKVPGNLRIVNAPEQGLLMYVVQLVTQYCRRQRQIIIMYLVGNKSFYYRII